MSNDVIFGTQIISIIVFILTVFGLYKLLISQKDSTIQTLKERIEALKEDLQRAKETDPDILLERYSNRATKLEEELVRLTLEKPDGPQAIKDKEKELGKIKFKINMLNKRLQRTQKLLSDFFCPHCGAMITERRYDSICLPFDNSNIESEREYYAFECGLEIVNGREISTCCVKDEEYA